MNLNTYSNDEFNYKNIFLHFEDIKNGIATFYSDDSPANINKK